jgi:hypothetical protein
VSRIKDLISKNLVKQISLGESRPLRPGACNDERAWGPGLKLRGENLKELFCYQQKYSERLMPEGGATV